MSYWKKALSIGLAAVMTASMLAGCSGKRTELQRRRQHREGILQEPRLRRIIRLQGDIPYLYNRNCSLDGCMAY